MCLKTLETRTVLQFTLKCSMALPSCTQLHIAMVYTHWISPRWNYNIWFLVPYVTPAMTSTISLPSDTQYCIAEVYSLSIYLSQNFIESMNFSNMKILYLTLWHSWYISKVVICDPRNDINYMHADVSSQRKVFWQPLNIVCQIGSTAMYSSSNAWSVWTADVWRADLLRHDAWQTTKEPPDNS